MLYVYYTSMQLFQTGQLNSFKAKTAQIFLYSSVIIVAGPYNFSELNLVKDIKLKKF